MKKKYAEPDVLRDALGLVPEDHKVTTNAVGNLAILDADDDYVGYIDFRDDCHVVWIGEIE